MHKRCSGLNSRLDNVVDFKSRTCLNPTVANDDDNKARLGNVEYKVVDQVCYLSDMLSAHGGAETSSVSHIKSGWKRFSELLPLLTSQVFPRTTKGRLYSACVRNIMLYGSETWPPKESDISRIAQTDMQTVRWMYHVSLKDRKFSEELRNWLSIANITDALR